MESYFDLVKRFTTKKTLPAASPACLILFDPVSWLRTTPESVAMCVAMWPCGHVAMWPCLWPVQCFYVYDVYIAVNRSKPSL